MKRFQRLSLIMCVTWSILLVLIITFGTTVSSKISKKISQDVNDNKVHLKDVIVDVADYYVIEKSYLLKYEATPKAEENYGLIFTSLSEDVFTIDQSGYFVGKRLENDINEGILQITSEKYPEFKKTYKLTFKKIYPDDFKTKIYGGYENDDYYRAFLNVPIFVKPEIISSDTVTELSVSIDYDNNYFDYQEVSKNYYKLTPKVDSYAAGDDFTAVETTIGLTVNGVKKNTVVQIIPSKNPTKIDELVFKDKNSKIYEDQENFYIGDNLKLAAYVDGTELYGCPYKISSTNLDVVKIDSYNNIKIVGPGTTTIKYEIPNKTIYEKTITVRRTLKLPTISDVEIDGDVIHIKAEERKKITINYGNLEEFTNVTFDAVGINCEHRKFNSYDELYLLGYLGKTGTLNIVVDDGYNKLEKVYNIVVDKNNKAPSVITRRINNFIHKVAGHMAFFALEAFLAFWMFTNYHFKQKWLNVILYFLIGLFLGSLTEIIQKFMPGRSARVLDVIIDMGGYLVGCLAFLALYGIILSNKKRKGGQHEESTKNS